MDIILAEYKKWRVFYKHQHNWPPRRDRASISDNHSIETAGRIGKDDIELESGEERQLSMQAELDRMAADSSQ